MTRRGAARSALDLRLHPLDPLGNVTMSFRIPTLLYIFAISMKEMTHKGKIVDRAGRFTLIDTGVGTYAVGLSGRGFGQDSLSSFFDLGGRSWDKDPQSVAGLSIVPWGPDDQMPRMVRDLLEKNNIGPGILQRKLGLIYGQGVQLYRIHPVQLPDGSGAEMQQEWTQDTEVQSWLDTWDYQRYARECLTEYLHMGGHFTKYQCAKSVRIGKAWIHSLKCLPSADCRLVWPDPKRTPSLGDITEILVGDMERWRQLQVFPRFDKWYPTKSEAAVDYHSLRSFGRNLYAISSFHGSIPWMQDANDIAEIVRALNDNVIAAAYIVHEPQAYWREKQMAIEADHPDWSDQQVNKQLDKLRDQITRQIADVMAGKRNAGKFFTCVDFVDDQGHVQEWKIEPIELNLDKYIQAQKDISRMADSATTSAMGLSPALSNIIIDGKSDSGSQMLYALKIFYGADTTIPEQITLEALNNALRINFPGKRDLFFGFYHKIIQKEDNVSAGDRAVNQQ